MPKHFTYKTAGRTTTYDGWDRNILSQPKFIALIRDEDCIDVLAVEDPAQLDGVLAYVDDEPCTDLLGIWVRQQPVAQNQRRYQLQVDSIDADPTLMKVIQQMLDLSPTQFDKLIELLK